ncbi:MAG: homoaconitate hydratase family protein [Chloroflexi bacterium]|nr:MAG: homoaconitate hydratase family protein [Chloroflexota bacterium]
MTAKTLAEKILSRSSGRDVRAGDLAIVPVSRVMVHDSVIDAVMAGMKALGKERVWDTERVCVFVDHAAPAPTPVVADSHRVLREWVRGQRIATFYDAGEGVCHQIMVEDGFCEPGTVIVGSDSHSNSYGSVGAFGAGMGATDIAVALALGRTWLRVPESIKVQFVGQLRPGVTWKDAITKVVGEVGTDGARYACVEFHGVGSLPQGDRITLSGMSTEMGAKAGIVVDTPEAPEWLHPDADASYTRVVRVDLDALEPQVAVPPRVDQVVDVSAVAGTAVDIVFLGSCTNGRLVDMRQVVQLLRGRRIAPEVRLEVVPASRRQFEDALADGTIAALSRAGAVVGASGCGPCLGRQGGVLAGAEICLSTANRNYKGRMGSPEASIYIGSPYVAAVAALTGVIDDPRPFLEADEESFDLLVAHRRRSRPAVGAASARAGDRARELVGAVPIRTSPQVFGMEVED